MTIFILLAVVLLAFSNGANDNFKGVATLFGSGTAQARVILTILLAWVTTLPLTSGMMTDDAVDSHSQRRRRDWKLVGGCGCAPTTSNTPVWASSKSTVVVFVSAGFG